MRLASLHAALEDAIEVLDLRLAGEGPDADGPTPDSPTPDSPG
jgi:hypothetical protein